MPRQKPPEHQAHQRDPLKSKRAKSRPSKPPKPQPKPKPGNRTDKIRLIRGQPKGPSAKTPEQAQPKPDPPPAYPFQINNVKHHRGSPARSRLLPRRMVIGLPPVACQTLCQIGRHACRARECQYG